jgi:hypothetical protein
MEEKISAEFVELASVTSNGFKVTALGFGFKRLEIHLMYMNIENISYISHLHVLYYLPKPRMLISFKRIPTSAGLC